MTSRVGDLDLPAGQLESVVREAGPVLRLDRAADLRAVPFEPQEAEGLSALSHARR